MAAWQRVHPLLEEERTELRSSEQSGRTGRRTETLSVLENDSEEQQVILDKASLQLTLLQENPRKDIPENVVTNRLPPVLVKAGPEAPRADGVLKEPPKTHPNPAANGPSRTYCGIVDEAIPIFCCMRIHWVRVRPQGVRPPPLDKKVVCRERTLNAHVPNDLCDQILNDRQHILTVEFALGKNPHNLSLQDEGCQCVEDSAGATVKLAGLETAPLAKRQSQRFLDNEQGSHDM
ncbi:hypothetical protein RvY_00897 [Ramazzottius varieornatus]|uniref:Uncharacterized protein n=1 Tax=Ramazzottius varieornatus TaxID=947166 RepID=A0A1D1UEE1_RAMVA|nr:hypothetical protein RvY_00897 [Ramazzottius varieornatus]